MVRFGHDNFGGAFRIRSETIKNHCLRNSFRNGHFPLGVPTFRNASFFIGIQVFAQTIKNPLGCCQIDGFLALLYKVQIGNPREIVQKHWFSMHFVHCFFCSIFVVASTASEFRSRRAARACRQSSAYCDYLVFHLHTSTRK